MPTFVYKALKADGSISTGELEAGDRSEAFMRLDRGGLQPVSLDAKAAGSEDKGTKNSKDSKAGKADKKAVEDELPDGPVKLKKKDVVLFTEGLAELLNAGFMVCCPEGGEDVVPCLGRNMYGSGVGDMNPGIEGE